MLAQPQRWEITRLKQTPTYLKLFDWKAWLRRQVNWCNSLQTARQAPRIAAPKEHWELFFVFSENCQSCCFPQDHLFLLNSISLPFKALPPAPRLLLWARSSFPPEHWDQLFYRANPAFPLDFAASVTSVWGLRAFAKVFLAAPGWSRCFCGGIPANADAAGYHNVPREPRRVFRASDWYPLSHLLVRRPMGYFRDKDISSHCSFLCFSEFCHYSTSSVQREGEKSAGTLVLILLPGWALWGAKIIFSSPCVISDSRLLENKVQSGSETDDAVFKNKSCALSPHMHLCPSLALTTLLTRQEYTGLLSF